MKKEEIRDFGGGAEEEVSGYVEGGIPTPKTFFRRDKSGRVEEIEYKTGRTVRLEKGGFMEPIEVVQQNLHEIPDPSDPSKSIIVDRRINLDNFIPANGGMPYSKKTADIICEDLANGKAMYKLCEEPGMPSLSVIRRWRAEFPEFDQMVRQAYKDRAEREIDENVVLSEELVARQLGGEDDAASVKVLTEQKRFRASKDNEKYDVKKSGEVSSGPIAIQIVTHVPLSDYAKTTTERTMDETGMVKEAKDVTPKDRKSVV